MEQFRSIVVHLTDDFKSAITGEMRPFILNSVHDDSILQLIVPVRTY
ncbi:hypothetical protein MHH33_01515 [Paenisporosarcina sp. FSL H8-0542]